MSKLPDRNPSSGYIRPEEGVGYVIVNDDGTKRTIITAHGIHLNSSDFSDLYLPALLFTDETGLTHEVSINKQKQLLVDDVAVFNLEDNATRQAIGNQALLTAPDGSHYRLTVDNAGKLGTKKM